MEEKAKFRGGLGRAGGHWDIGMAKEKANDRVLALQIEKHGANIYSWICCRIWGVISLHETLVEATASSGRLFAGRLVLGSCPQREE